MPVQLIRLKEVRESKGLSQRQLADLCGIGESQIYRYENGITEPLVSALKTISSVLNVSTDYLLGLTDRSGGLLGESLTREERKLLTAFSVGDSATIIKLVSARLGELSKESEK